MNELPPLLVGFLDGLCVASRTHFPEGGMHVSNFHVDEPDLAPPQPGKSESRERLMCFFVCVLGDTAQANPAHAKPVVEMLLEVIERAYPLSSARFEIREHRGWFDGLDVWISSRQHSCYFSLAWSVS